MKCYIAGRTNCVDTIKQMRETLEAHGHSLTYDWTKSPYINTQPYPAAEAPLEAQKELRGVEEAEVFILLSDGGGTGLYVELGFALAQDCLIYSVGEHNDQTLFQHLPQVKRVTSFAQVIKDLTV